MIPCASADDPTHVPCTPTATAIPTARKTGRMARRPGDRIAPIPARRHPVDAVTGHGTQQVCRQSPGAVSVLLAYPVFST
ncbi:hypothetical protein [Acetobacter conturbans]|uniref:hypothetical protein n=1 Tax=Acetobacter conturbans TaxID=1737472 RepID=UPI00156A5F6A|nr:hypothetical protein [Acetobacter conturbans]